MTSANYATDDPEEEDKDRSRAVLEALDNKNFSWYHVKAILVSGVGFFTDAYDLFIINLVVPMIGQSYFYGHMSVMDESLMKGAATIGTLIGQLGFGILADVLGRKKMYGVELAIIILGTFCCAISAHTARGWGVVAMVTFWRFVIGVGVGGDYPLSAIITSEYASVKRRGQMMAAVFAMQGMGILTAAVVAVVTLASYRTAIESDQVYLDDVWRICVAVGIIPALIAVYFRLTLPETPRYTMHVRRNLAKATQDTARVMGTPGTSSDVTMAAPDWLPSEEAEPDLPPKASFRDFCAHFGQWKHFKVLFGCCTTWCFLDVAFYGLGLNQTFVLNAIGYVNNNGTFYQQEFQKASGNAVISMMGTVPGYWVSVLLIDRLGRIKIQLLGFIVLTTIFIVLAAAFNEIIAVSVELFISLYCVALFFFNFGPNTTTFIIPGEVFPTRYRSTGHGISAACGKAGAIIAAYSFPTINKRHGTKVVLAVCACFMALGTFCTFFLPETMSKTLEELSGDGNRDRIANNNKKSAMDNKVTPTVDNIKLQPIYKVY